ncbi:uncharacterized protein PG998_002748 [Apiospora kogelbergensis]|uniref:uncharacterized protein n=1 Tax=Apiospora kogelbergensis TaxID=1337665 RepID=UPI0031314F6F
MRQPPQNAWDQYKPAIKRLYIDENLPLPQVMEDMIKTYDFKASIKMYKDRFREWKWAKNIPQRKAKWMLNKLNERQPQKTTFWCGDLEMSEERVKKLADAPSQDEGDQAYPSGPTPSDVEYHTPFPLAGDTPQAIRDLLPLSKDPADHNTSLIVNYDTEPEGFNIRLMNMSDLHTLLRSACEAVSAGKSEDAEAKFRDSLVGFRHLLTPTHEETLRAGYMLASFYANLGRMADADAVLDWMTYKHVDKWGAGHEKTLTHHTRLVKLLHQWGRTEQAVIALFKLMDDTNNMNNMREGIVLGDLSREERSLNQDAIQQVLMRFPLACSISEDGFADLLPQIIELCEARPDQLGPQVLQARCILAKCQLLRGEPLNCTNTLSTARETASRLLRPDRDLPPRDLVNAASQLAFTFMEANEPDECNAVLDAILNALQIRPPDSDKEEDRDMLMSFLWATAADLNRLLDWSKPDTLSKILSSNQQSLKETVEPAGEIHFPPASGANFTEKIHQEVPPALAPSAQPLPDRFIVAITGDSQGLGRATAAVFARAGARGLILSARTLAGLEETQRLCEKAAAGPKEQLKITLVVGSVDTEAHAKELAAAPCAPASTRAASTC